MYTSLASSLHTWGFVFVGLHPYPISFYVLNAAGHPMHDQYLTWLVEQVRCRGVQLQLEA